MLKQIIVAFLAINAIFWGLFPHSDHCAVASVFTNSCLPHSVHVSIGVICFVIAVVVAQYKLYKGDIF
jgi:hypothetical protein